MLQQKWLAQRDDYMASKPIHTRSDKYTSRIIEAVVTNQPYQLNANMPNTGGLITYLPLEACVEVPCLVNSTDVHPTWYGALPEQCADMNRSNINLQLMTMIAAKTRKREDIYRAALLDPHTSAELSPDEI